MNKLEANICLFAITFFAAIQYVFLVGVPDSVSDFAFLCITNFVGFAITFIIFFNELFRLDKKHIVQCLTLSILLFGYNIFLLLGSSGVDTTVLSCVLCSYFIFIPPLSFFILKQKIDKFSIIGSGVVLVGLLFMTNFQLQSLMKVNFIFLVIANLCFAIYILMVGKFTTGSNPSILAMGQMFFNFIFSLIGWIIESFVTSTPITLPTDHTFWGSVIFISLFIRVFYGIIQIYAQRYVSPLNTSLIFSSEIIITLFCTPIIIKVFNLESSYEPITVFKIIGVVIMILGMLIADESVVNGIKKKVIKHG